MTENCKAAVAAKIQSLRLEHLLLLDYQFRIPWLVLLRDENNAPWLAWCFTVDDDACAHWWLLQITEEGLTAYMEKSIGHKVLMETCRVGDSYILVTGLNQEVLNVSLNPDQSFIESEVLPMRDGLRVEEYEHLFDHVQSGNYFTVKNALDNELRKKDLELSRVKVKLAKSRLVYLKTRDGVCYGPQVRKMPPGETTQAAGVDGEVDVQSLVAERTLAATKFLRPESLVFPNRKQVK
jgi:hypothetical protein